MSISMQRCLPVSGNSAARQLTFRAPFSGSGYGELPQDLTINGTTVSPTFRYVASDATTTTWSAEVGDDLAIAGSGDDPVIDEYAPGIVDKRVDFPGSKYYQESSASFSVGTDDIAIECMWRDPGTTGKVFSKWISSTDRLELVTDSSQAVYVLLNGATIYSGTFDSGAWNFTSFYLDRSGQGVGYTNTAAGTPVDISTHSASTLGATAKFTIGARTDGSGILAGSVAYLSLWQSPNWLDTHLQADLAKERFYRACGIWPAVSKQIDYIEDGDMEAADTSAYTAGGGAILTKDTSDPYNGVRNLKIATATGPNPYARQSILTTGQHYDVVGVARSDGSNTPRISDSLTVLWSGTTSTSWQPFSFTFRATASNFDLYYLGSSGYVEFDDVKVTRSGAYPTVATRSTTGYVDKIDMSGNRILVPVGAEWMRACKRSDANSDTLAGYLPETQGENEILDSEDFSSGSDWTLTRCTVSANAAVAPDGTTTADGLIASTDNNQTHEVQQSIASSSSEHVFSVWLKKAGQDWAALHIPIVANAKCYYDLSNGVLGTAGAGCTGRIEDWGNGWYRCSIIYTGGAASHSHDIHAAVADEDDTYTGDGSTVEIYMWGAMHEDAGLGVASSYIATTSAAVTRTKDQLRYAARENIGGEDVGQGTIELKILAPDSDPYAMAFCTITDGGSSSDRILFWSPTATDSVEVAVGTTGASSTSAADPTDNEIHSLKTTYANNMCQVFADGTGGTVDTTVTVPDDLDRIDVGQGQVATGQPNCIISDLKIYKKPV